MTAMAYAAQLFALAAALGLPAAAVPWRARRRTASAFAYQWALVGAAAVALLLAAASLSTFDLPHGDWDAWSIWNLRARFLGHAPWWQHAASPLAFRSHPDYPLLLPALVSVLGHPGAIALFFAAAGVAALAVNVWRLAGTAASALAVLTLAVSSGYLLQIPSQYADIPLSVFILVSLAALLCEDWLAAGSAAGAAAFTKNEGLVFALALVLLAAWRHRSQVVRLALGAAPGLALTAWFKLAYAPPSEYAGQSLAKLADPARWWAILSRLPGELLNLGMGIGHPLVILGVLAFGLGFAVLSREWKTAAMVLGCQLGGYLAAYLLTPNDLAWQLDTSMNRLAAQVWPAALLLFFTAVRPPGGAYIPR